MADKDVRGRAGEERAASHLRDLGYTVLDRNWRCAAGELDIVAAVIIGGTNIMGGQGKLSGTLLGVLFIGILSNGMILLVITPYMQQVVRGLVILGAVLFTIRALVLDPP